MADSHKNFAVSTVATAPSPASSGTTLVVASGHGTRFPTTPFNAVVCPAATEADPSNAEVVRVTNISTNTFTITRAQEGSSARSIIAGDRIYAAITAKSFTDVETPVINLAATADKTGATDAAPAIRAALAALNTQGGGVLYVPKGTYLVNSADSNLSGVSIAYDNIEILGEGPGSKFLGGASLTGQPIFLLNGWGKGEANGVNTTEREGWIQTHKGWGLAGTPKRGDCTITLSQSGAATSTNFPAGDGIFIRTGSLNVDATTEPDGELNEVLSVDGAQTITLKWPLTKNYVQEYHPAGPATTTTAAQINPTDTTVTLTAGGVAAIGLAVNDYLTVTDSRGNGFSTRALAIAGQVVTLELPIPNISKQPTILTGATAHKGLGYATSASTALKAPFSVANVQGKVIRNNAFRHIGIVHPYLGGVWGSGFMDTTIEGCFIDTAFDPLSIGGCTWQTIRDNRFHVRGTGTAAGNSWGKSASRMNYVNNFHSGERIFYLNPSEGTTDMLIQGNQIHSRAGSSGWSAFNDAPLIFGERCDYISVLDNIFNGCGDHALYLQNNSPNSYFDGNVAFGLTGAHLAKTDFACRLGTNYAFKQDGTEVKWAAGAAFPAVTRTLPTTVGNYIEIGTFDSTDAFAAGAGTHLLLVTVASISPPAGPTNGNSVAKAFIVQGTYDQNPASFKNVQPLIDGLRPGDGDFALEASQSARVLTLRLRRTVGTNAHNVNVIVQNLGTPDDIFAPSSGTGTSSASGNWGLHPAYTVTNPTTDRALNVTGDTTAQVAQVLGTLISDLQARGLVT